MGRGDDDARPPIEFLGSEPSVGSSQQVALGPRRPKPGGRRSVAIAVAVVAVLGAGLLLGGRDDKPSSPEERDNQDRIDLDKPLTSTTARRPTTTTSTTEPDGPPLGEPVEGVLLVYSGAWTRTDLTTGEVTRIALPPASFWDQAAVTVPGGLVVPSGNGEIWYVPVLGSEEDPNHVVLGPGDRALRAGPGQVWLIAESGGGDQGVPPSSDVRLVDLDGQVLRQFQVPGSYLTAATSDAVVISRGGRVYAVDEDGIRPIATGTIVGTVASAVLVVTCDDRGDCVLASYPTDGGSPQEVVDSVAPEGMGYQGLSAQDGRVAIAESDSFGSASRLLLFDSSGAPAPSPDVPLPQMGGLPQILPGDLGFLLFDGQYLQHVYLDGDEWRYDNVRTDPGRAIEGAFVVTP